MAHFKRNSAMPIESWVEHAEGPTLTIRLGSAAAFNVWGGGPGTGELDMQSADTGRTCDINMAPDVLPDPQERAFWCQPSAAGNYKIRLMVPGTTTPFAQNLTIVVLPTVDPDETSEHLIIYGSPAGLRQIKKTAEEKRKRYSPDAVIAEIDSIWDFRELLIARRTNGHRIKKLEFLTHGWAGQLWFGSAGYTADVDVPLTTPVLESWRTDELHDAFAANAAVFCHGCKVAAWDAGETFLETFGTVLLRGGGGSVGASTSYGLLYQSGLLTKGRLLHYRGDVKRVHVDYAGRVYQRDNFGADK